MSKEEIEKIFIAYYPPREQCVFSSGSAAVICKDILDQQTKELQERVEQLQAKIDELEKANEWISVDIEPEFGGEYNVVYDLEDGDPELVVTTLMYCKLEKTWRDERGANYIVNTVKLWRELPNKPKTN